MQVGSKSLSLSFVVSHRFHAGYSLLGRLIRRRVNDEHYAEGIYILALAMIGVGLVLLFFLAWSVFRGVVAPELAQFNEFVYIYSFSQLGAGLLFFLTCLWGRKPALEVELTADQLTVSQGEDWLSIPRRHIQKISCISALEFHRHYRTYAETRSFFVRIPSHLLLLSTDAGPVVLGMPVDDQKILKDHLSKKPAPADMHSPVSVS